MSTQAGIWQAVSTAGQDEAHQLPDLLAWCESHGYAIADGCRYVLHAKSRFHGKQDEYLDRAFADMAAGRITVLVVWAADRIERRGALAALTLAERARKAGGRIEYVKDSHLNTANELSGTMLALAGDMARMESQRKSDRTKAGQAALRASGHLVGRPPWGYAPAGEKYAKRMVPTAAGETYVPDMFAKCIAGESVVSIATWLDSAGAVVDAKRPALAWSPKQVNQMLRNPAYAGRRQDGAGRTVMTCPALVTAETFAAAGAALDSRTRRKHGHGGRPAKRPAAMLTGTLHCAKCGGPMYRIGAHDDFAGYYRCTADPRITGKRVSRCGNMIPVAAMDALAWDMLARSTRPVMAMVWSDGDDSALRLADVTADIESLTREYAAGLPLAEYVARLTLLDARRTALESAEPQPGRYVPTDTGQVYGDLVRAMGGDASALRKAIAGKISFYADSASFPAGVRWTSSAEISPEILAGPGGVQIYATAA